MAVSQHVGAVLRKEEKMLPWSHKAGEPMRGAASANTHQGGLFS